MVKKVMFLLLAALLSITEFVFAQVPADTDLLAKSVVYTQNTYYVRVPQSVWTQYIFTDATCTGDVMSDTCPGVQPPLKNNAGQRLADGTWGRHGNDILKANSAGKITVVIYFGVTCGYCRNLLKSIGSLPNAFTDVNFVIVDAVTTDTADDMRGALAEDGIDKFPEVTAYYNTANSLTNVQTFANDKKVTNYSDLESSWTNGQTSNYKPYVLVFQGNGTDVDLRAIVNGPNAYGTDNVEMANIIASLRGEDPFTPLDFDNPEPHTDKTTDIVGTGDYVTYTSAEALYADAYSLLDLINAERANYGGAPYVMDTDLLQAAMQRAAELTLFWQEDTLNGNSVGRPNGDRGLRTIEATERFCCLISYELDEAIAKGEIAAQDTPAGVLDYWKTTGTPSRDLIYDGTSESTSRRGFTSAGIGVVRDAQGRTRYALIISDQKAVVVNIHDNQNATELWKIALSQNVANQGTVSPVQALPLSVDMSDPNGLVIDLTLSYPKTTPADGTTDTAVFWPTYLMLTDPSVADVKMLNGKLMVTPKFAGTTDIVMGYGTFVPSASSSLPMLTLSSVEVTNTPLPTVAPTVIPTVKPTSTAQPRFFNGLFFLQDIFGERGRMPETGFSLNSGHERLNGLSYDSAGFDVLLPSLDVSAPVVFVPQSADGYDVERLGESIGLLEGSAKPGEGVTVLSGHNHLNRMEVGPFLYIRNLELGDRLFVRYTDGNILSYQVYANTKAAADDIEAAAAELRDGALLMITCEDESLSGGYENRRLVYAELISE